MKTCLLAYFSYCFRPLISEAGIVIIGATYFIRCGGSPIDSVQTPDSETESNIGRTFGGRYKAVSRLGEGGWGSVYKGVQLNLDQTVAIKVLKKELRGDKLFAGRFQTEARIYAKITNPHVVSIHDFGEEDDGTLYLVMEFVPGMDLDALIQKRTRIETSDLLSLAAQVTEGLAAAHALGVVHRDIKPANVIIQGADTGHPFARLLDFGVSKVDSAEEESSEAGPESTAIKMVSNLTVAGQIAGTPAYMSPEQCQGLALDERSDIYAMGILMYEMAVGRPPFVADNLRELLLKQCTEAPKRVGTVDPDCRIPSELEDIIMLCLRKNPAHRFQSAAELLTDLETLKAEQSSPTIVPLNQINEFMSDSDVPISTQSFGEADQSSEEAHALAQSAMRTLSKAYRSFSMYPRDNPIIGQATENLLVMLQEYNEKFGELVVNIDRTTVYHQKKRVFDDPELRTSFPFKLFSDGIRRFIFHKDVTLGEVSGLLECLKYVLTHSNSAVDLVTLLWERRFKGMSYLTVEELTQENLPDVAMLSALASGTRYAAKHGGKSTSESKPTSFNSQALSYGAPLSLAEKTALRQLVATNAKTDQVSDIVRSLLALLLRSKDDEECEQLLQVINDLAVSLVQMGHLPRVLRVMRTARKAMTRLDNFTVLDGLGSLLERMGSSETIARAFHYMRENSSPESIKYLGEFITLLNPTAAPNVVGYLTGLDQETELPTIQWSLLKLCGDVPALVAGGLYSDNADTRAGTLRILGEMPLAEAEPFVTPALAESNPELRAGAIEALYRMKAPGAVLGAIGLIRDDDAQVRIAALTVLAQAKATEEIAQVYKLVTEPSFSKRSIEERDAAYQALRRNATPEGVEILMGHLEPRVMLSEKKGLFIGAAFGMIAAFTGLSLAINTLFALSAGTVVLGLSYAFLDKLPVHTSLVHINQVESVAQCLLESGTPEALEVLHNAARRGDPAKQTIVKRVLGES